MKRHTFTILALVLASLATSAFAQQGIDRKRMQRDLDIMEAVLGKLMNGNGGTEVQGLYFDGYGVIFLVNQEFQFQWTGRRDRVRYIVREKHIQYGDEEEPDESEETPESDARKERLEILKSRLTEFFGTYADAIGQLKDTDRITVLANPGSGFPYLSGGYRFFPGAEDYTRAVGAHAPAVEIERHGETGTARIVVRKAGRHSSGAEDSLAMRIQAEVDSLAGRIHAEVDSVVKRIHIDHEIMAALGPAVHARGGPGAFVAAIAGARGEREPGLEATAKRSDILAHGRGRIDEEAFRARIAFRELAPDAESARRIDIMAGILDRALSRGADRRRLLHMNTAGIYLEDLGAIFFTRPASTVRVRFFRAGEETEDTGADRLKADLVEIVADYGHTLRILKPAEYIVVQVDLSAGPGVSQGMSRMTVKARKQDVDAYNQRKIGLDEFKKRIEILTL